MTAGELRKLPSVDRVAEAMGHHQPQRTRVAAARAAIADARTRVMAGEPSPSLDDLVAAAESVVQVDERRRLNEVINATGVLIHTNLGRVPLGVAQLEAVTRIATTYNNLEFDLTTGRRGDRYEHASAVIRAVTGAESALVVNNNAAAVLLTLAALCGGRDVIISRGELIEIGGEFRIPDVMTSSGVRLVEVGTTNRTHATDYVNAITPETAAILKVHPSNYRVVGFTASVAPRSVARVAREHELLFIHDLGSGLIDRSGSPDWMQQEPSVDVALEDGADVVTFSGDKLLGGPQAGIIAGRRELVEKIARHPLLRALRVDKMTLAALEATFDLYLQGSESELPLWAMALAPLETLEDRAKQLAATLQQVDERLKIEAVATSSLSGGGSAPGSEIPSWAVAIAHQERSPDDLSSALRSGHPPVIGRIENDRLLLDLRTVSEEQDARLGPVVAAALRS